MKTKKKINFHKFPDKFGRFGKFGGRFVAETLMPLLIVGLEDFPALSVRWVQNLVLRFRLTGFR